MGVDEVEGGTSQPHAHFCKYLPATLRANDGKIIKTQMNRSFRSTILSAESILSGPAPVNTIRMPRIPKTREAAMNTRVASFCIDIFYL